MLLSFCLPPISYFFSPYVYDTKGVLRIASLGCEHMAVVAEGGMPLRLRGESKVQAGGPFYLSIVQLVIQDLSLSEALGITRTYG